MDAIWFYAVWTIGSYLLGSALVGDLVCRAKGIDIRKLGTGNPGTANIWRQVGPKYGIAVFVLDILKGVIVTANKITFTNIKLNRSAQILEEFSIVDKEKEVIISMDEVSSYQTVTTKDMKNTSYRSVGAVHSGKKQRKFKSRN